jgi:beta-glucosidase
MKHKDIIDKLSLEQKAAFCSGKDFWHLYSAENAGLPEIMVTDGPHGLRKQNKEREDKSVKGVLDGSFPATCFPAAATTSCSWDTDMIYEMGEALGEECLKEKVSVLLGPGINIKRSPLCGRNFEYFSEDPFLTGEMGVNFINGVQSKGVGTSLKHFAANNQENRRMTIDSIVDERALREIYLTGFERCVKDGKPWTVMNAYNRLNGTYCSENEWLLSDVLRKEWGYYGVVVTDWGAENDIVLGLKAGQNLEMPSSGGLNPAKIVEAVKNKSLREEVLNERVDEVVDLILKSKESFKEHSFDIDKHHALARKIAANSVVLLKNKDEILPLSNNQTVAVIGHMAKEPRYQGAGSSLINPTKLDNALDELSNLGFTCCFAQGYDKAVDIPNQDMIDGAVRLANTADVAVVFIGLTEVYESEGFDRKHINLPPAHNALVKAVAQANKNTVVVLSGGAAVTMPWLEDVRGVVHGFLGGQAGGGAIADVLSGKVNPSGKLTETYPLKLEDNPSYEYFPGNQLTVEYRESIYVGYRYYDKALKSVLFPFGYGLSYTTFEYSDIVLDKTEMDDTDTLTVKFTIKNTGNVDGAEVAQVYVGSPSSTIFRPEKELKAFKKVFLKAGEEKEVSVTLSKRAFAYYNVNIHDWHVETGEYTVLVGASSRDILLSASVKINSTVTADIPDYSETAPAYYSGIITNLPDRQFTALLGRELPLSERDPSLPIDINCTLEMAAATKRGEKINKLISTIIKRIGGGGVNEEMMKASAVQIPIRCFVTMSLGVFSWPMAQALIDILNGKSLVKATGVFIKNLPATLKKLPELMKSL